MTFQRAPDSTALSNIADSAAITASSVHPYLETFTASVQRAPDATALSAIADAAAISLSSIHIYVLPNSAAVWQMSLAVNALSRAGNANGASVG